MEKRGHKKKKTCHERKGSEKKTDVSQRDKIKLRLLTK